MYAPQGWTAERSIEKALENAWTGDTWGGCRRFERLGPLDVHLLAMALPEACLRDRHNNAPTSGQLIQVVLTNPGNAMIGGYRIEVPRADERISIDSLWIRGSDPKTAWEWLERQLPGLPGHHAPDEADVRRDQAGGMWVRLWWD